MITVRLQGGLGNQLFQYAAALAVRKVTGHTLWFIEGENAHNTLHHDYVAELFVEGQRHQAAPPDAIAVYRQYSAFEPWMPNWFGSAATIYLEGYFQSLPELVAILPELRASFLPALHRSTRIHLDSSMTETGFVHVRRGDYLLNPTYHWIQPVAYYEAGMSLVKAKKWLIFSDDIPWCRQQACFQRDDVVLCDEPNELIALHLMSSCSCAVISNSSFSWWAAMLGGMDAVVYPNMWSEHHKPNLFPETWTMLS